MALLNFWRVRSGAEEKDRSNNGLEPTALLAAAQPER